MTKTQLKLKKKRGDCFAVVMKTEVSGCSKGCPQRLGHQTGDAASQTSFSLCRLQPQAGLFHKVVEWLPPHIHFVKLSSPKRGEAVGGEKRKKKIRETRRVGGREEEGRKLLVILRNPPGWRGPTLG